MLDGDGESEGAQPPPTTKPPPPTTTTAPTPTTTEAPKRITWDEVSKGLDDYNAGRITREEYEAIVNRWDCQNGWQAACK